MDKKIFALDAGHGGDDPGAIGFGINEKDITLDICQRISAYVSKHYPDIDCRLTRDSDKSTSLSTRTNRANRWKADCLVSVHINSFAAKQANGFESFTYITDGPDSKSLALQKKLHKPLANLWAGKNRADRGMRKENFHVLREFRGASVLLELGFISNAIDAGMMQSETFLQRQAEEIADAVADFFGVTKDVTKPDYAVYRVVIDGKQVGAYRMPSNIGQQVDEAMADGAKHIKIEQI